MRTPIILLLLLAGCSSPAIRLSCDESCSLHGMKCTGATLGEAQGGSYTPGTYSVDHLSLGKTSSYDSSSTTYICAKDPSAASEIKAYRDSVEQKFKARQSEEQKRQGRTITN